MSDRTWNRAVAACEWCVTALVGIGIGLCIIGCWWLFMFVLIAIGGAW